MFEKIYNLEQQVPTFPSYEVLFELSDDGLEELQVIMSEYIKNYNLWYHHNYVFEKMRYIVPEESVSALSDKWYRLYENVCLPAATGKLINFDSSSNEEQQVAYLLGRPGNDLVKFMKGASPNFISVLYAWRPATPIEIIKHRILCEQPRKLGMRRLV